MTEPSPVEALIDRVLEIGLSQQHIDSDFARATNAAGDLLEASATMGRLLADNERLRGALTTIADESVFNQQRYAEDTDTDYFLRCFKAVKDRARQALSPSHNPETVK